MNELQIFNYKNTEVRTIIKDGEPWFVASDVCRILGLSDASESCKRINASMKGTDSIGTPGGKQDMLIVSEAGLFKLAFTSRKPSAERFTDWVASEVLPSIRKTGKYEISQHRIPKTFSEALQLAADQAKQIEEMTPKAEAFDELLSCKNAMTMNEAAKTLDTGRTRLFAFLRESTVLIEGGPNHNLPRQEYQDRGLFLVRQVTIPHSDWIETKSQTLVTARGLEFIRKKLTEDQSAKAA